MSDTLNEEDFSIIESAEEVMIDRSIEDQISNNYYMWVEQCLHLCLSIMTTIMQFVAKNIFHYSTPREASMLSDKLRSRMASGAVDFGQCVGGWVKSVNHGQKLKKIKYGEN